MIDDHRQDLAMAYALDSLDAADARAFEAECAADPELRTLAAELRTTAAALAHDAPRRLPPPHLRAGVLAGIRGEAVPPPASLEARSRATSPGRNLLPWVLAAGFAVTTAALWMERDEWRAKALAMREEAMTLRNRDALAQVRIATLSAKVDAYAKSTAVVVWDAEKQRGIIKLANVPSAGSGKDYQLWVIDPRYQQPVSGGVIPVGDDGLARVSFTPDQRVGKTGTFAISVERAGGSPQPGGPIVLLGN